jgi:hypothetical protein
MSKINNKNMFTPKTNIDEYIDNNELNSRIYDALLKLKGCKSCNQHWLKREPLEIFNRAYAICDELQFDEHPELLGALIWDRLRDSDYLVCETNIIFSCVYVILTFSETENKNMKHFLALFKHIIDKGYFKEFEPLIGEELTYITPLSTNFEFLQTEGDKIQDLNQRELFYSTFLTHSKQAHSKGNIERQVADEIKLIHITKELSDVENDNPNEVSNKVRAVVTMEILKKLGHC